MSMYVLVDYAKDDGKPAIDAGTEEEITKRYAELKKLQSYQEDPGRYDIMPLKCYKIAFGCTIDENRIK